MIWAVIVLSVVVFAHISWDVKQHLYSLQQLLKLRKETIDHFGLVDQFIASVVQRREQLKVRVRRASIPPGYVPPAQKVNDYWVVVNGRREVNPKYRGNS